MDVIFIVRCIFFCFVQVCNDTHYIKTLPIERAITWPQSYSRVVEANSINFKIASLAPLLPLGWFSNQFKLGPRCGYLLGISGVLTTKEAISLQLAWLPWPASRRGTDPRGTGTVVPAAATAPRHSYSNRATRLGKPEIYRDRTTEVLSHECNDSSNCCSTHSFHTQVENNSLYWSNKFSLWVFRGVKCNLKSGTSLRVI